jgi:HSP20 family protein
MKGQAPWTGLGTLRKEMDALLERAWDLDVPGPATAFGEWAPKLDLAETSDALVVKAEIPGIDPQEIHLALDGDVLTIKGNKTREKEAAEAHYYRIERAYGAFTRSLRLPVAVEADRVTATFKNGLLTVMLPKSTGTRGTTIPIEAA